MSRMEDVVEKGKTSRAKTFLAEMKRSLSQVNFDHIVLALQSYKKNDDLDVLLSEMAVLIEDANTHSLLRGMSSALVQHCGLATCYLHLSNSKALSEKGILSNIWLFKSCLVLLLPVSVKHAPDYRPIPKSCDTVWSNLSKYNNLLTNCL